ncbi:MAG: hypothetical protein K2R98_19155 [Gemmataceae bacterium]|nr:hypothetical protein [Gemmataceae bacterium]
MIQLPHRSVTRFFIPLIDVLTLLFCIFLLMPVVKSSEAGDGPDPLPGVEPRLATLDPSKLEPAQLLQLVEQERRELERLRKEKIEALQQRLVIHVLEIDGDTGTLYYRGQERVPIATAAEAHALIRRQKNEAGSREPYYLILFPVKATGFPTQGQFRTYERWFAGTVHGFSNPLADALKGGTP